MASSLAVTGEQTQAMVGNCLADKRVHARNTVGLSEPVGAARIDNIRPTAPSPLRANDGVGRLRTAVREAAPWEPRP